jgi:hypothetical protein
MLSSDYHYYFKIKEIMRSIESEIEREELQVWAKKVKQNKKSPRYHVSLLVHDPCGHTLKCAHLKK